MKRSLLSLISLFCAVVLSLSACGNSDGVDETLYSELQTAVENTNKQLKNKAKFLLNITDGDTLILFAQGSYSIDKTDGVKMTGEMVQTVLEMPSSFDIAYGDGYYYTVSNGVTIAKAMEEKDFMSQFMCSDAPFFEIGELSELNTYSNDSGLIYRFCAEEGMQDKLGSLFGTDIYTYAGIKKLQHDKISYGLISCDYIVSEEYGEKRLVSRNMCFNITAYDTPPYYPNYTPDENEYKKELEVTLRVNYLQYGDGVEVGELPKEPSSEEPSGEEPSSEEPSGEEPSSEEPSGEEPSGEEPTGEMITGKATYSYNEMCETVFALDDRYDAIDYSVIGKTTQGRDIYVITVGDINAEKHILFHAGMHAKEYMNCALALNLAELYAAESSQTYLGKPLTSYSEEVCIHIIPMVNPDGVEISQTLTAPESTEQFMLDWGVSPEKLKDYYRVWKANAAGVDLNRNFDAEWEKYRGNDAPTYRLWKGPSPHSEPETKAMVEYTLKYDFSVTLSYHSYGETIYWNYGEDDEVRAKCKALAETVSSVTGYRPIDPDSPATAGYKDWAILQGIPSLTVETGDTATPLPEEKYPAILNENKYVFAAIISEIDKY